MAAEIDDTQLSQDGVTAMEEQSQAASNVAQSDASARLSNWTMHQNCRFLHYLKTTGYGKWEVIAEQLENELKLPYRAHFKKRPEFLRQKWHNLRGPKSILRHPFKFAPFNAKLRGKSKDEKAAAENVHVKEQEQARKLHEEAQQLLKQLDGKIFVFAI